MVCLGLEPGAAGWKAQMNPLSYGDTSTVFCFDFVWLASKVDLPRTDPAVHLNLLKCSIPHL